MEFDSRSFASIWEETEGEIAEFNGTRYAVLCSSARTAIRLSLLALNIGYGSEVVIPDFACQILPITAFCVGATPRFCDVGKQDLVPSLDQLAAAITPRTKAIIYIHLFGLPTDPSPIVRFAHEKGIAFIDDAAQALGASVNGRKSGSFGDLGVLTFNKFLDIDLGGAVTTNDQELAEKVRNLRQQFESRSVITSSGYWLARLLGLRSRLVSKAIFFASNQTRKMTGITFAKKHFQETDGWVVPGPGVMEIWRQRLLPTQIANQLMTYAGRYWHNREMDESEIIQLGHGLKNVEKSLQDRRQIAASYKELLGTEHFSAVDIKDTSHPSYLRYPIFVDDSEKLNTCITELAHADFRIDYRYKPLHLSPFFSWTCPGASFKGSTYIHQHILPLPIHPRMDIDEVQSVVSIVKSTCC